MASKFIFSDKKTEKDENMKDRLRGGFAKRKQPYSGVSHVCGAI